MMDLNGKWAGTLVYGNGYPENIINQELSFELIISEFNEVITGYGKDIAGCGINPSECHIRGFVDGDMISFIKQYKSAGYFDQHGASFIIEDKASIDITYNGTFNPEKNQYEGEWDILLDQEQYGNKTFIYECVGTWTMHKLS